MARALLALCLLACVPRARLLVVDAPDVALPVSVHVVGVFHGVPARSPRHAVAEAAVRGFLEVGRLARGYRVRRVDPPLGDAQRPFAACAEGACDAVVVLSSVSADRSGEVETTWTTWSASGEQLDALPSAIILAGRPPSDVGETDVGETPTPTREQGETTVPALPSSPAELGYSAGAAYARRMLPIVSGVTRPYFVRGDRRLQQVWLPVRVGDWSTAERSWREVLADPSVPAGVRARARHNLALRYEVLGRYHLAWREIAHAIELHAHPRTARYQAALAEALSRHRVLRTRRQEEP